MLTSFVCCVNIGSLWHLVVVSDQHQLLKYQVRSTSPTFNPQQGNTETAEKYAHGTNRLIFKVPLLSIFSALASTNLFTYFWLGICRVAISLPSFCQLFNFSCRTVSMLFIYMFYIWSCICWLTGSLVTVQSIFPLWMATSLFGIHCLLSDWRKSNIR